MTEESLFHAALAKTSSVERTAFLDEACGTDLELRHQIESLLEAHHVTSNLLDRPHADLHEASTADHSTDNYTCNEPISGVVIAGRYTLEHKIGEGGMGEVWIAAQCEPVKRKVAIKFIRSGIDSNAVLARFDQERQALAIMDHPNIAKILDGGTTETGRPYFVMELVRGLSITKYCDHEKLTPRERLALFAPICQGVQHAHQKGIIHRDIKPSNILVGIYDGKAVPKIIDFGVAKAIGRSLSTNSVHTEMGSLLGTLEYMSPEQADLTNLDIDTHTDVYALGVILYELLTGTVPFTRNELADAGLVEMLVMIKEKEPQKPSTRISTLKELPQIAARRRSDPASLQHLLAGELDWIIMKCLEKERARRYDSPLSLAGDLQRFLADEPVLAAPPSAFYRIKKFVKRYRGQVLAAGLLFFVLIGGVIATSIGMWMAWKAEQKALHAETVARNEADLHRGLLLYLESDLFGQFDPDIRRQIDFPPNKNITVRALVDNAARRMGKRFEDMSSRVQAASRRTLGIAFGSLGEYSEALAQLEAARNLIPRDDPYAVEIEEALGILLFDMGMFPVDMRRLKESESYLVEVVKKREQMNGLQDLATLHSRFALGSLERFLGKWTDAEKRLTLLLEDQRKVLPMDHPDIPRTMNVLADIDNHQRRYEAAEKRYKEALAECRKNLPLEHPQTITVMNNLAHFLRTQGKHELAMKLYEELLPAAGSVYDRDEPLLLIMKNNQAVCYWHLGSIDKAEALFQEVLEGALRITEPESKFILELKRNMASIPFKTQNWQKAVQRYDEIVEDFTKEFGTGNVKTWEVMENLAYARFKTQDHDKSLMVSKELMKFLTDQKEKIDGKRYYRVLRTALDIHMLQNHRSEAEQLLRTALQALPKEGPEYGKVKALLDKLLKEQ
ncbi:MAG TPA: serine/threonine-protein kinase [Gemmatales bacterium]|nr:serine/threonine-protein kinase [Gemmatales bacterium]